MFKTLLIISLLLLSFSLFGKEDKNPEKKEKKKVEATTQIVKGDKAPQWAKMLKKKERIKIRKERKKQQREQMKEHRKEQRRQRKRLQKGKN